MSATKTKRQEEEKEQEEVWREVFDLFDKDKNGQITTDELGHVIRALDFDPTVEELKAAEKELDKDGNGIVEFNDFKLFMSKMKKRSKEERKEEMMQAFRIMDKNGDNYVDADELMSVLSSLGEKMTREEVEAMIKVADVDTDGKINYKEFVKFVAK